MALNLSRPEQVTQTINRTVAAANKIAELETVLNDYEAFARTNDLFTVLTGQGAVFPANFTVTPSQVEDARFALVSVQGALLTSLQTFRGNLERLRLALGVLSGTG